MIKVCLKFLRIKKKQGWKSEKLEAPVCREQPFIGFSHLDRFVRSSHLRFSSWSHLPTPGCKTWIFNNPCQNLNLGHNSPGFKTWIFYNLCQNLTPGFKTWSTFKTWSNLLQIWNCVPTQQISPRFAASLLAEIEIYVKSNSNWCLTSPAWAQVHWG